MGVNTELLQLARLRVQQDAAGREKSAVVAAEGAAPQGDPAAAAGMPPGGAPPMDPAMMGAAGAAPPMDPAMMGGMPGMAPGGMPMDPAMMGAMGGAPAAAPAAMPGMPGAAPAAGAQPGQKMKPEQMMQQLSYQLYFIQQQLTAIMNHTGVTLPPGALVLPPGVGGPPSPVAAMPGGPLDPATQPSAQAAPQQQDSAIQPIEPMQGAVPQKQASYSQEAIEFLQEAQANAPIGYAVQLVKVAEAPVDSDVITPRKNCGVPRVSDDTSPPTSKVAALAALLKGKANASRSAQ